MTACKPSKVFNILVLSCIAIAPQASAQMPDRYPELNDYGHQIYFEQHELPAMAHGPTDPAPAPNGKTLAFAAQGWIWLLDLSRNTATRMTDSQYVDSRPRWSPEGKQLAFVRDYGSDTGIVVRDIESGKERSINSPALDLDPEFSADGEYLFYANSTTGSVDLWRHHLASGKEQQLSELDQVERNIRRVPGGAAFVYLDAQDPHRSLRLHDIESGKDEIIHAETLTYHLTADVHPELPLIVYSAPIDTDYHLWTMDINDTRVRHRLTDGSRYALTPSFSASGHHVYFVEADDNRQFHLKRINTYGGEVQTLTIEDWDYGAATGNARISVVDGQGRPTTARVSLARENGHPVPSPTDATYMDTKTGRTYFYVEGDTKLSLPVGRYKVEATRGFFTPVQTTELTVKNGSEAQATLQLTPIWSAQEAGYASADYHNHLNGDGTSRAKHEDALRAMAGEDLEHTALMSWNRWERRIDRDILGKRTQQGSHVVDQGQEVRSHFHGHIGIIGIEDPYEPWFWGPSNPVLGDPNLANADVIDYAKSIGAFPTFVHPGIPSDDPLANPGVSIRMIDALHELILQDGIGFEVISGWDGPMGNVQLWYRLLNLGRAVPGISGTDGWVDFYRTPALGTARNFVPLRDGKDDFDSVLAATAAGRGFLSTGPALLFTVSSDARPGDVIATGTRDWSLDITSTSDVDRVEIIVNGQVATTHTGVAAGKSKTLTGTVNLPAGGWIAARAYSTQWLDDPWPAMLKQPFAHSQPIWIGEIGSTDPDAFSASATDLALALDAIEQRAREAYGDKPMDKLYSRFNLARQMLEQ
ncbi:hypothetical protein EY643_01460 [Halioglobus maricola]|uniref:Uncharacterized protein n=1 Tax=Halioglobus maricola TaxID=2601894 RepID=A0A5P9NFQ8_9GAMM|nr:CehA/McbA family metallohydrolase [Halioglobus maricola]QFU74425.1 hypothetical protein EY643_01460 [Halioglobus maricola]